MKFSFKILLSLILTFSFLFCFVSFSVSASSETVYRTSTLQSFLELGNGESDYVWTSNSSSLVSPSPDLTTPLICSWDNSYSDSIQTPYMLNIASPSVSFTHFSVYCGNLLSSSFTSSQDYLVQMPMHFLIVGGNYYYPSSSFNLYLVYEDENFEIQVLTISATDYSYVDANRDHFYCNFVFTVPGFVLNHLLSWNFRGYRSVARFGPIRMGLNGQMRIMEYDPYSDLGATITENNNYNTNRILANQNEIANDVLNGYDTSGQQPDSSSIDDVDSAESALTGQEFQIITGYDSNGNPVYSSGTSTDLATSGLTNIFQSIQTSLSRPFSVMAFSKLVTSFVDIPDLSILFYYSLGLGVFAVLVGLGINAMKSSDRNRHK